MDMEGSCFVACSCDILGGTCMKSVIVSLITNKHADFIIIPRRDKLGASSKLIPRAC